MRRRPFRTFVRQSPLLAEHVPSTASSRCAQPCCRFPSSVTAAPTGACAEHESARGALTRRRPVRMNVHPPDEQSPLRLSALCVRSLTSFLLAPPTGEQRTDALLLVRSIITVRRARPSSPRANFAVGRNEPGAPPPPCLLLVLGTPAFLPAPLRLAPGSSAGSRPFPCESPLLDEHVPSTSPLEALLCVAVRRRRTFVRQSPLLAEHVPSTSSLEVRASAIVSAVAVAVHSAREFSLHALSFLSTFPPACCVLQKKSCEPRSPLADPYLSRACGVHARRARCERVHAGCMLAPSAGWGTCAPSAGSKLATLYRVVSRYTMVHKRLSRCAEHVRTRGCGHALWSVAARPWKDMVSTRIELIPRQLLQIGLTSPPKRRYQARRVACWKTGESRTQTHLVPIATGYSAAFAHNHRTIVRQSCRHLFLGWSAELSYTGPRSFFL